MPTVYRTRKHIPSKDHIFTKHTRQLLKYIESRPILPFRLSNTSQKCVTHILKMIHHSSVHMPSYKVDNIQPTEMNQVMTEFEKSKECQLIPPTIWSDISTSEKIGRIVTSQLHSRSIHLYLILPKSDTHSRIFSSAKLAESFFHTCARRIIVWLDVALQFAGKECADTLGCYLFFTNDLKKLPKKSSSNERIQLNNGGGVGKGNAITPRHANTAFTYSCIPTAKIVLFRMEEWFKVFIHESFHCFGLDFSEMNIAESNKHMSKLFPKCHSNMDFRVYETYCETWAETINIIFLAYFARTPARGVSEALATQSVGVRGFACEADVSGRRLGTPTGLSGNGLPSKDNRVAEELHLGNRENVRTKFTRKCSLKCQKEFSIGNSRRVGLVRHLTHSLSHTCILHILRQIEHMIQRERMFSVFQMSKVLAYHSLKYTDLCSTSTLDNSPKYTEETQVFAYYIVKPVLLFHLNEFIEWCHTHNGHNRELLFKKTEGNIREYGELIERLYMLPEFIKTVETEQTNYSRFSSISKDNVKDTLRMSLFE